MRYGPSRVHALLLRAALAPPDEARVAWSQVEADPHALDGAGRRLLPLVWHNLREPALQPHYLEAWGRAEAMKRPTGALLQALEHGGVLTCLLKGGAVIELAYGDCALRPMDDLDVLVRHEQARPAWRLLEKAGWRADDPVPRDTALRFRHGQTFVHPEGARVDLHWRLLADGMGGRGPLRWRAEARPDTWEDDLWARAVPCRWRGVATRVLDPTDTFFHACAHGLEANRVPSCRWIADAAWLWRTHPIDWTRVVARARTAHVVPVVAAALRVVAGYRVEIPEVVLDDLRASPLDRLEKPWLRARTRAPGPLSVAFRLALEAARKVRAGEVGLADLPAFLQARLGVARPWEVPACLARLMLNVAGRGR